MWKGEKWQTYSHSQTGRGGDERGYAAPPLTCFLSGEAVIFGICLPLATGSTQEELRKIFNLDSKATEIVEASSLDEVRKELTYDSWQEIWSLSNYSPNLL